MSTKEIYDALNELDLDKLKADAEADIRAGKRAKRGNAVAILNTLKGMERNNIKPSDFMISKVPIIPPKYRPFSAAGETIIVGDANTLYKDLYDIKAAYDDEKEIFGEENSGESRLALYDAVSALYGYADPVKAKSKSKDIRGFLKHIVGRTAKQSMVQMKMFSKTQDNTGRSTVAVNPDLGIDEIELPYDMAFTMYAPYIQRRLKRKGIKDAAALKHVKDRTPEAKMALEQEVVERPVIYSRAPAWHAFSLNAGKVKLIDGSAIRVNPYITTGMGMDFDGNCVIGSSKLVLRIAKGSDAWKQIMGD